MKTIDLVNTKVSDIYGINDIIEELKGIEARGNLASVRVEHDKWEAFRLYDVCEMTQEEYLEYRRNGGVWEYKNPSIYIDLIVYMDIIEGRENIKEM